jgi:hypothetical protein
MMDSQGEDTLIDPASLCNIVLPIESRQASAHVVPATFAVIAKAIG